MKVMGFNGSPRRGWNTSTLLEEALAGAASEGAETEMVDLYSLTYSGCRSCFACKRIGLGDRRCYVKDDLTPVLDRAREADVLIFGSPIYFYGVTAGMAALMERLYFPYTTYNPDIPTFCDRVVPTGFIYTMNAGEEYLDHMRPSFSIYQNFARTIFGTEAECYHSLNTWQYSDYDRYEHSYFDVEAKRVQRETQFPRDMEACREMGVRLVRAAKGL